jgi:hypothetical protein
MIVVDKKNRKVEEITCLENLPVQMVKDLEY